MGIKHENMPLGICSTINSCRFFHQFRCLVVHWNREKRCCSGKRKGAHPTFSNSEPFWSFWPISFCRCRVLFSYQPVHDDELELKVFPTEVFCFHNFILRSGFHYFTSLFQVDQNLDFMCEVEDGWWKGRVGGRVSWSLTFLMWPVFLINRLVFSPPTLSRCVKMTQLIRSNPVQKQSRNYPYRRRFENWSIVGKAVFISALLFRHLSSCRHHWRRGLWPRLWRRKTRKILSGQTGEQQFPWEGYIM